MGVILPRLLPVICALLTLGAACAACAETAVPGSTSFCLYEIPVDDMGKRRWINLGIVQYVEATRSGVKISYGGGAFGSGYDARITVSSMEEALAVVEKIRKAAAAACR